MRPEPLPLAAALVQNKILLFTITQKKIVPKETLNIKII
jgi:hypothetical protein